MKCTLFVASMAGMLACPVMACDDHHGKCQIEGWRFYDVGPHLMIEGIASCDSGHVIIRLFDGETYLGNADGYIEGHAFSANAFNIQSPSDLNLKYSIDPES